MAEPFIVKAGEFEKIAKEQLEKVENPLEKLALKDKLEGHTDLTDKDILIPSKVEVGSSQIADKDFQSSIEALHKNPNEFASLENLRKYHESRGQIHLAAYYKGRIIQAQATPTTEDKK